MDPNNLNFAMTSLLVFALFVFATIIFLSKLYRRCPSNKILVVYGKVFGNQAAKCLHGGGTFVWPLIQDYAYLDLTPRTIHIPLTGALSFQNIRINVPSTFTVAVDTTEATMNQAAVRLLGLDSKGIESMAVEIITGQLRLTVASLRIEEINQDRERFLECIRHNIEPELSKIGLSLINVNVTDITDEAEYIESIGKKAAATAINQAKIDVAEQEKLGDIGKSLAEKERRIQVATYQAQAVEGENQSKALIAMHNAELAEKEAEADQRSQIADQNAQAKIQHAKAEAESKRLEAEQVVPKEIEKRKIAIDAEAVAEKARKEAQGQADAILSIKQAEAEGTRKLLEAKAEGYRDLVSACGNNAHEAGIMLMIEKLEEIVKLQTEAIKNLKIDKITVWDSGQGTNGSSTANFVSSLVKSLPALHDVAQMAGMELPEYLGKIKEVNGEAMLQPEPSEINHPKGE
ncbi:MAG: SPFH domain-containing protein [Chlamydiota bacterium]